MGCFKVLVDERVMSRAILSREMVLLVTCSRLLESFHLHGVIKLPYAKALKFLFKTLIRVAMFRLILTKFDFPYLDSIC
jgi:hypothetical protein